MIWYNIQFFAKDGPGGEKTEPATAKKLQDARKEGQVAKSKEIVTAISLVAFFVLLKFLVSTMGKQMMETFQLYNMIPTLAKSSEINYVTIKSVMQDTFVTMLVIVAPVFAVGFVVPFVGELYQVKWKPTGKPLQPKFSKMNPLKGFKRIFSMQSMMNLLKAIGIIGIVIYIVWNEISKNAEILFGLYEVSFKQAIAWVGNVVINLGIKISIVYLVIGLVDLIYQKRKFNEDMKMTKQEVKEEMKNTEGNPEIKSQLRRRMMQVSQRRMMQSVPQADVVITNPTHFAVALKYDLKVAKAPLVVAKGEDYLAGKIKEAARESEVEIVENKPLARMLYFSVDIGQEIPEELYQAVAEVLAFVYALKKKK